MEGVCDLCRDQVFNRKAMDRLWTRDINARDDHMEGHRVTFTTSRARLEAGLKVSCPLCHLLQNQMLHDLEPSGELLYPVEGWRRKDWDKGHRREIWFRFDQVPPFELARLYVPKQQSEWSDVGYDI